MWVTLAEPPSWLEDKIADQLVAMHLHVRYWFVNIDRFKKQAGFGHAELKAALPKSWNTRRERFAFVLHIDNAASFSVPIILVSYPRSLPNGDIRISSRVTHLCDETILVCACPFDEMLNGANELAGPNDIVGLFSLFAGPILQPENRIAIFFDSRAKKFVNGDVAILRDQQTPKLIAPLRDARLDATRKNVEAALWFVGRAAIEPNRMLRVIFYQTAIELATGKGRENVIRKAYKYLKKQDQAAEIAKKIRTIRDRFLHHAQASDFSLDDERNVQLLLLDLISNGTEKISRSALFPT